MSKSRKMRCPHCGFLDTIKKGSELAIRAIIVKLYYACVTANAILCRGV